MHSSHVRSERNGRVRVRARSVRMRPPAGARAALRIRQTLRLRKGTQAARTRAGAVRTASTHLRCSIAIRLQNRTHLHTKGAPSTRAPCIARCPKQAGHRHCTSPHRIPPASTCASACTRRMGQEGRGARLIGVVPRIHAKRGHLVRPHLHVEFKQHHGARSGAQANGRTTGRRRSDT